VGVNFAGALKDVRTTIDEIHELMQQVEQAGEDVVDLLAELQTAFDFLGCKWPLVADVGLQKWVYIHS
jgi:hypothetical protein